MPMAMRAAAHAGKDPGKVKGLRTAPLICWRTPMALVWVMPQTPPVSVMLSVSVLPTVHWLLAESYSTQTQAELAL